MGKLRLNLQFLAHTMTAQPQPEPTLRDLADKLDKLTVDVDQRFDTLSREFERSNDKFEQLLNKCW